MHYAAHHGNHETIMALLARKREIDVPDTDGGTTALMFAAGGGHVDAVNVLVAAGADVDAKDNSGFTPLRNAKTRDGAEEVVAVIEAFKAQGTAQPAGQG